METFDELKKEALDICDNKREVVEIISQIISQHEKVLKEGYKTLQKSISSLYEGFSSLDSFIIKLYEKGVLDFIGLYSKPYLEEKMNILSYKNDLAFLMCDIDNFKKYNDAYGQLQGDEALKAVANQFKESVEKQLIYRESSFTARYGGEEFCAFIGNYKRNAQTLYTIAENIRKDIEKVEINKLPELEPKDDKYKHRTITIAVGIRKRNEPINLLRKGIDKLLKNKAKQGKNKVYLRT